LRPGRAIAGLLSLTLPGCIVQAAEPAAYRLSVEARDGDETRPVAAGSQLANDAEVRFVVHGPAGRYLSLLARTPHNLRALLPTSGDVWTSRAGRQAVAPRKGSGDLEVIPEWWSSEESGEIEYLLIETPVPRAVPADSWLSDLDTFLLGPPWLQGPAAKEGAVVATLKLTWGEQNDEPEVGGEEER
jgi:hypothetical protein